MKTFITAAFMLTAASVATFATGQALPDAPPAKPFEMTQPMDAAPVMLADVGDARSLASDCDVGEARRAYRASCERTESHAFCECVTAGVAQALMPEEVRIAARTSSERLSAQGDAASAASTDATPEGASSRERIEQVEGHYADACTAFRR